MWSKNINKSNCICLKKTIIRFQNYILFPGVSRDPKDHECDLVFFHTNIKSRYYSKKKIFVDLESVDHCTKSHAI